IISKADSSTSFARPSLSPLRMTIFFRPATVSDRDCDDQFCRSPYLRLRHSEKLLTPYKNRL
ncbi:hypothetical protein KAS41_04820, partial [Candidatus Parcubacteria bacterium]|nr:hypothetical protein [Candidatus Parcubacteria bacterium]